MARHQRLQTRWQEWRHAVDRTLWKPDIASLTARLRDDTHSLITGETRPITISLSPNTLGEISDRKSLPAQGLICSNIKIQEQSHEITYNPFNRCDPDRLLLCRARRGERHHYDHGQLAG
ncbi:hypothetical protein CP995_18165 [Klebsiella pneumoniae]|nr:hypothetical protein CP995_18165 [Klebsiella pneumoniae]